MVGLGCREGLHEGRQDGNRGFTYSGAMARKIIVGEWTEAGVVVNREDPSGCYYYFDDPRSRLRFIVADSCDSEESGDVGWGVRYGMHEKQLKWLEAQAFGTIPDGWSAVVMHHIPVTGVVGWDDDAKTFAAFRAVLDKYHDRVILDLTGHHHAERQTFQNGILHVTEPCDAAYADYIAGSSPWCGDLPPKQAGTIFEQTFDAVQIDRERGCVYFTRVGGGQDRVIHLTARKVKVGETVRFRSGHLSGDVKFGCYDGDSVGRKPNPSNCWNSLIVYKRDFAEISDGGLHTARKPGPVMVLAMDKARNKEIFPVEVGGCV